MTLFVILFYIIAVLMITTTTLAVTRRNLVHTVLYLVLSFFGSAMLFYLLGAPFLAALEIIIYAGAIMVLFLFIIMMIRVDKIDGMFFPKRQLVPAMAISAGFLIVCGLLISQSPGGGEGLSPAQASPKTFGLYLFQTHWLAIEIASLLLLIALIGTFILGRQLRKKLPDIKKETP